MIKRLSKIAGLAAIALILVAGLAIAYTVVAFPRDIPVPELVIEPTPARIERGRYLANHVANCFNCHAERNWRRVSGPVVAATRGKGGPLDVFGDGRVHGANITPFAIGTWSDGEVLRAITSGLAPGGRLLHPEMPYFTFSKLTRQDAYAIVAYLRTLVPIPYRPPRTPIPLWMAPIARTLPKPFHPQPEMPPGDTVAHGRYLVGLAGCSNCHRPDFSGGMTLTIPQGGGHVDSMNITPVQGSRIGSWSRKDFIGVFKAFTDPQTRATVVEPGGMNTVMPWIQYSDMTEADLGAIYDYLRTVKPVTE